LFDDRPKPRSERLFDRLDFGSKLLDLPCEDRLERFLELLCLLNFLLDFPSELSRLLLEDRPDNPLELLCLPCKERRDLRSEVPRLLCEEPLDNVMELSRLLCEELPDNRSELLDSVLLRLVSAFSLGETSSELDTGSGTFGFSSSSSASILSLVSISWLLIANSCA